MKQTYQSIVNKRERKPFIKEYEENKLRVKIEEYLNQD